MGYWALKEAKEGLQFSPYLARGCSQKRVRLLENDANRGILISATKDSISGPILIVAWSSKWLVILHLAFLISLLRLHITLLAHSSEVLAS